MKFSVVAAILGLAAPALSHTTHYNLTYNTHYDNKDASLRNVTCWAGEHGLLAHGYKTFGELPTFPHVGGIPQIVPKNLRYCRTCWELTYTDAHGHSQSVNYTAIDVGHHHPDGFTTSLESMDFLTGDRSKQLKTILIKAVRKPAKACGLENGH